MRQGPETSKLFKLYKYELQYKNQEEMWVSALGKMA